MNKATTSLLDSDYIPMIVQLARWAGALLPRMIGEFRHDLCRQVNEAMWLCPNTAPQNSIGFAKQNFTMSLSNANSLCKPTRPAVHCGQVNEAMWLCPSTAPQKSIGFAKDKFTISSSNAKSLCKPTRQTLHCGQVNEAMVHCIR